MSEYALEMRNQLVGLFGIVERNVYLTKRYFLWDLAFMVWTIANTLTIVFIARSAGSSRGTCTSRSATGRGTSRSCSGRSRTRSRSCSSRAA